MLWYILGGLATGAFFGFVTLFLDNLDGEVAWLGPIHSKVLSWGLLSVVVVMTLWAFNIVGPGWVVGSIASLFAQAVSAYLSSYIIPLILLAIPGV